MSEKKQVAYSSPDLNKLQEVFIDQRTKIFIRRDANPVQARTRFLERLSKRKNA